MEEKQKLELRKIGLVSILGLVALIASLLWLKGHSVHNYAKFTFYFQNVNGLEEGAPLRWNGLRAGVVESVKPVTEDKNIDLIDSRKLLRLGKKHLNEAKQALETGKIENLARAREKIALGQLEISLVQACKQQTKALKGKHVEVTAVVTLKDLPIASLNKVSIVPSGLIGEQYLDITTLYMEKDNKQKPQFIALEPVILDKLMRTNLDSAESVSNLTNRINALFKEEDAVRVRKLIDSVTKSSDRIHNLKFKDLFF